MSFLKYKSIIEEGDTVVLYLSVNSLHAIDVHTNIQNKKGETVENIFQTSYGALKVKNLIGQKYGTKVELSKGYAYVFQPTPDLWTQTLPHRTQIIYTPDISMILLQLEIKPGSIVIESGTGSGSLSHFIIRAVKPHGYLHTFDFHQARVEQAIEEFAKHGISEFVTVRQRDVCAYGFSEELCGKADAVFLDLPAPWLVVPYAMKALKRTGGRFCSFSPCIEQSQRFCETLELNGFTEIQSMEIVQTEETVKMKSFPIIDLEFVKHKKTESEDENVQQNKSMGQEREVKKYITATGPQQMPGHTGYLSFATFPPNYDKRLMNEESQ